MKIVMTLVVRNESEALEHNLRYHFARGVDFLLATNHGSSDGSAELLRGYEDRGLARVFHKPATHPFDKGDWVLEMARMAAREYGADWVINNDADEFWWPVEGSLKDAFAAIPATYGAVLAPRPEFLPRADGPGSFLERMTVREACSQTSPKVAHRAMLDVVVGGGSHFVARAGGDAFREGGRAGLRDGAWSAPNWDGLVVAAPRWPIRILHFPVRSSRQFEGRAERILFEGRGPVGRVQEHHAAGRLADLYAETVLSEDEVEEAIAAGHLVRDTSLRDFMARCPDPLSPDTGAPVAMPVLSDEQRRRELSSIEVDVMHVLAREGRARRAARLRLRRKGATLRSLREKLSKARAELDAVKRAGDRPQEPARSRSDRARRLGAAVARLQRRR
jgi:hypothetical protein